MNLKAIAATYACAAKEASRELVSFDAVRRSRAIVAIAEALEAQIGAIVEENAKDLEQGTLDGLSSAMLDRLKLDPNRLKGMARDLREIASQSDPIGREISRETRSNGLDIAKVSVPLGVVFFIYESRPNVTTDAAALCLRSGNAILLRGGKEAIHSNRFLGALIQGALATAGLPAKAVQLVTETDRELVGELLQRDRELDLVIPRGGEGLIRAVSEQSKIPVLKHYKGVCHVYVHPTADPDLAVEVVHNSKVQRPSACNASETLLLDRALDAGVARRILQRLLDAGVELRGDGACRTRHFDLPWTDATESDWDEEYLSLTISVAQVDGVQEALDHIAAHGSSHTEAILCRDQAAAEQFVLGCDSSSVMVNTSTRFADGGEYGLGAEIGISTDKLHARGPMGAADLCTYKWIVRGTGQVRG
ncbi:MAG: glutamate-5-semialdehyde dehydrogenase [Fibrobacterota bacterium]|nr:glutamate-5-semialdehyde dehydrogenase [Fibrobacterota bacterium]QQS07358.1 MAG: glutamate-5-semialdehyde dehydrogenase [Fibrobacterota bacterium]